jgi:hypothetical protein
LAKSRTKDKTAQIQRRFFGAQRLNMNMSMNLLTKNIVAKSLGLQAAPSDSRLIGDKNASPIHLSHARRAIYDSEDNEDDFEGKTRTTFVPDLSTIHLSPCTPTSKARKEKLLSSTSGAGDAGTSDCGDREREEEYENERMRKESEVLKALDVSNRELLLPSTFLKCSGSEIRLELNFV